MITVNTYHSTGIQVALQSALGPGINDLVERVGGSLRGSISGLLSILSDIGSGSAIGRNSGCCDSVAKNFGTVLANKGTELVDLGALGN